MRRIYRPDGSEVTFENITARDGDIAAQEALNHIEQSISQRTFLTTCANALRDSAAIFGQRAAAAETDDEREKWCRLRNDAERDAAKAQSEILQSHNQEAVGQTMLRAANSFKAEMAALEAARKGV